MSIEKTNELLPFEIWVEGYQATGNKSPARLYGTSEGTDFNDAVRRYIQKNDDGRWGYRKETDTYLHWGCRCFDNETDARRSFG